MAQVDRLAGNWRAVYRELRERIDRKDLPPGAALPTIAQLAEDHGLSAHGARSALGRLREEGRAKSWQGFGYRVAENRINYRIDDRPRFGATMMRIGRDGTSNVLATRAIRISPELAKDMRLRPGTRVWQTEIVRLVEDRPVLLTRNHFPFERFDGIGATLAASKSVTRALAAHGVNDFYRKRTRIEVRMPTAHEGLQLGIPSNQPVLVTTGANEDNDGQVVELSHTIWRGDCVTFEV